MNEVLTTKARLKLLEDKIAQLEAQVVALQKAVPLVPFASMPETPPRSPLNYSKDE